MMIKKCALIALVSGLAWGNSYAEGWIRWISNETNKEIELQSNVGWAKNITEFNSAENNANVFKVPANTHTWTSNMYIGWYAKGQALYFTVKNGIFRKNVDAQGLIQEMNEADRITATMKGLEAPLVFTTGIYVRRQNDGFPIASMPLKGGKNEYGIQIKEEDGMIKIYLHYVA